MRRRELKRKGVEKEPEKEYLCNMYWEGRCCRYRIHYFTNGDGEHYPIPSTVSEAVLDLLQDVARMKRLLLRNGIDPMRLLSDREHIEVKDSRRVPLSIRLIMGD